MNAIHEMVLQVTHKLSLEDVTHTAVGVTMVTYILGLMASTATVEASKAARDGLSPSDCGDVQLADIIKATTRKDDKAAEQVTQ